MSEPVAKIVELDEEACSANREDDDAIEASRTVKTFGNDLDVKARGETGQYQHVRGGLETDCDSREFLSKEKNSFSRSSLAKRSSFKFNFFPNAPEFVSVSSRAMTMTGTGVADLAVFGLKTRVLMSSNDSGVPVVELRASRQAAGESVSRCVTVALMDKAAKD